MISKTKAPNIVGMLNIKENLDASFKLNPNNKAAVITVPDLEAPGNKARDWNTPTNNAEYNVTE